MVFKVSTSEVNVLIFPALVSSVSTLLFKLSIPVTLFTVSHLSSNFPSALLAAVNISPLLQLPVPFLIIPGILISPEPVTTHALL